jgi:hypothetical protein
LKFNKNGDKYNKTTDIKLKFSLNIFFDNLNNKIAVSQNNIMLTINADIKLSCINSLTKAIGNEYKNQNHQLPNQAKSKLDK